MRWRTFGLLLSLVMCSIFAVAQPSQEMPHRVFGTVEDTEDSPVTDTEIEVVYDGEFLESDTTNSEGYYDITVPYEEVYSNREIQIQVEGSQIASFTYRSGEAEEVDLNIEVSQQQEEQEDGTNAPSGGSGGSFSENSTQRDEKTNETEDTQKAESEINETSEGSDLTTDNDTDDENNQTENNQTSDETPSNFVTGLFVSEPSDLGGFFSSVMDSIYSFISNLF